MTKDKKRLLLLSAYDAKSHQHWRGLLQQELDEYEWTQIALPDRHFAWRVRGNSLTFATQYQEWLSQQYDVLIVTSMVDISALRGFIPKLASIPTLLYFHENQFDYPASEQRQFDANRLNAQLTSIYSLLCADSILFNSHYNQKTFFTGAKALLKKMPDGVKLGLLDQAEQKSQVLAVPINHTCWSESTHPRRVKAQGPVELVWNHRWEYDKQPEVLFEALKLLKKNGVAFKLHLLGQSFRKIPDCFEQAKEILADNIATWGYQPKQKYQQILNQADIVISTALHDFQGLSMLEAIAAGCFAVAPKRVAYPEYIREQDLYMQAGNEAESLFNAIKGKIRAIESGHLTSQQRIEQSQEIQRYSSRYLIADYRSVINQLIQSSDQTRDN